jgi:phytoene dehydrogenase-like protein
MMTQAYDVAIIGAGHNGLVCANYLARAGLKVVVVEARQVIGGACTTEELIPGGRFSSCSYIQMMLRHEIVEDLELKKYGLVSVAPQMQEMALWSDGDHVMLWQEIDRTLRSIEAHSREDGPNFMRFATRLRRFGEITESALLSDPPTAESLKRLFDEAGESELFEEFVLLSAEELLARYIKSDRLRGFMMFMGMVSTWGSPTTPGTAYVYGYHAQGEFEGNFGRYGLPKEGMGMIAEALARGLRAHGGELRVGTPVRSVRIEKGAATGLLLANGEIVAADIVVSGADPKRSLVDFLPEGALAAPVAAKARGIDQRGSMARIHLLIDALPDYVGFPAGVAGPQHQGLAILGPTPALYEKAWQAQQRGEFCNDYVLEALIPSVTHSGLAPSGQHTLSLGVQQLPFDLARGSWVDRKEEWADLVMEIYFRYAPNIRKHILGRHVITPLDLEWTYNITGGNIFHASMVGLENLLERRPISEASTYRTPISRYYLCGSGSHPGGGVSGAPGHNAAHRILADLQGRADERVSRGSLRQDMSLLSGLLKTGVGQKLGYQVARSRVFRSVTELLNRNR